MPPSRVLFLAEKVRFDTLTKDVLPLVQNTMKFLYAPMLAVLMINHNWIYLLAGKILNLCVVVYIFINVFNYILKWGEKEVVKLEESRNYAKPVDAK